MLHNLQHLRQHRFKIRNTTVLPSVMLRARRTASVLRRCHRPFPASSLSNASKAQDEPLSTTSTSMKAKNILSMRASPAQKLRNVMEALDEMIAEADRKVEKKYRPNMFGEFKQLNDTAGKVLDGAEALIEVGKAKSVPSLKVVSLEDKRADIQRFVTNGNVTLMLTSFKNYGLNMLAAWRDGFVAGLSDKEGKLDTRVQTLTLNVIEEWYMKPINRIITNGLRAKIPQKLHATTFTHFGRCDDFRTPMALDNSFVGYAHLVDAKGRIRWMYVLELFRFSFLLNCGRTSNAEGDSAIKESDNGAAGSELPKPAVISCEKLEEP
ncbi:hypothetical protein PsorP6_009100 [Peronosclerospora sorghi]|uniref:Uncharacterized protein n=1 Tax=Peronosclerospora sorghi TaxID=230839 RepID=A0ACC0W1F2_9STRA|nr:hypothetical protein PsorP6_009100 [Peronosclerospora sorghi]